MKVNALLHLPVLCAIGFLVVGCQSAPPEAKRTEATPRPASPFPLWCSQDKEAKSDQLIRISTKLIEIKRPVEGLGIPEKRYEKKMSAAEFEKFMRGVTQVKGADLMTAPQVVTPDGKTALIQVVRDFVYPTGPGEEAGQEVEKTGVISHSNARHLGQARLDVRTFTRVSEFEGFSEGKSGFELPVFHRRDLEGSATLESGETIVIGGLVDEVEQDVVDTSMLGLVREHTSHKFSRELIVTVTATLVRADGTTVVR